MGVDEIHPNSFCRRGVFSRAFAASTRSSGAHRVRKDMIHEARPISRGRNGGNSSRRSRANEARAAASRLYFPPRMKDRRISLGPAVASAGFSPPPKRRERPSGFSRQNPLAIDKR
jgi:hypothetical protein